MSITWAMSDLHGRLDLFEKAMKYINPNDKMFYLGDAIDRGPDGWELLKRIVYDYRITPLLGNHEDMFANAYYEFLEASEEKTCMNLWLKNGGDTTWSQMIIDKDSAARPKMMAAIDNMGICAMYVNKRGQNIFLSHSGYDIWTHTPTKDDLIWDRTHYFKNEWFGGINNFVVHGHTPSPIMIKSKFKAFDFSKAYNYCEGHKFNLDMGSANTGIAILFNLDTFESIPICEE